MPTKSHKEESGKEKWLQIELAAPPEMIDALSNFLLESGSQGIVQEEPVPQVPGDFAESHSVEIIKAYFPLDLRLEAKLASIKAYMENLATIFPDLNPPTMKTEALDNTDWGEEWKKYFKPLRVSKNIVIKPTWERYTPTGRDIVIEIDPGMAFGTGQHPSTRMCLEALEDILLKERAIHDWNVLDVGTGTGILGIACAKLGAGKILCVDSDMKATEITQENVVINEVADRVEIINADLTTIHATFNLIVANLTAKVLLRHRNHLIKILDNNGYLIISGIIEQNQEDVEAHFIAEHFKVHHLLREQEWLCYILRKEGPRG